MELSELSKIKPRHIKLLQEAGINSIEALAMSVPRQIEDIQGMSENASKMLIWDARDTLNMSSFRQVSEIEENYDFLTTGSSTFDAILEGGISTGRITEVYGAFKSGKTNLAHTLAVTCQLPEEKGGLNGAALYIDTENTFSRPKIERIARRFGIPKRKCLEHIFHARIFSSDHQMQMIRVAETAIKEKHARLVVVDSLMALLRSEYLGIGMLAARQQVLNRMIHDLSRLAETYNVAVLLTNQVTTKMKGVFSGNDAIGGNIVAHGCHFRIQFKAKGFSANSSLERKAVIVDAPDLAPEEASFFITEAGICDTEEITYLLEESEDPKTKSKAKKAPAKKPIVLKSASEIDDPLEAVEKALTKSKSKAKAKAK
jgi:DNA repair protein RadA